MPSSRLAPTPSGYLHLGNALNFMLTWLLTRHAGGELRLRIDDLDQARVRVEYLDDIFETLDWLGLDYDQGPATVAEHQRRFSQVHFQQTYLKEAEKLLQAGLAFACDCSRKTWQAASPDGQYPGTCRSRQLAPQGKVAWRLLTLSDQAMQWEDGLAGPQQIDLHAEMRDFVIRRKDGIPAYQLASVVDDLEAGTTLIVRGKDLLCSTAAQLFLARQLDQAAFAHVQFYHHPLLLGPDGQKLSKSAGSLSLQHLRQQGTSPAQLWQLLAQNLGLSPQLKLRSGPELLACWQEAGMPLGKGGRGSWG
jgi:glutamyl-tRNA synthetase